MIGLDTNVLLRLFANDDHGAMRARLELRRRPRRPNEPCLVNPSSLPNSLGPCEKLTSKKRPEVARLIEGILSMDDLEIPYRAGCAGRARGIPTRAVLDFADCLIAEINT